MYSKRLSLSVLSISLLIQSSPSLGASKNPMQEIKNSQQVIIKNKHSIEKLLNTRAHVISKEVTSTMEASMSGAINGEFSMKSATGTAIKKAALGAMVGGVGMGAINIFSGVGAMTDLLKTAGVAAGAGGLMGAAAPEEVAHGSLNGSIEGHAYSESWINHYSPKIYSITVVNPEHSVLLKKINQESNTYLSQSNGDAFNNIITQYIDSSIQAGRYMTYKEAETLTTQIGEINHELQNLEELSIQLPSKDQAAILNFSKSVDEWLLKKIIFINVAQDGFTAELIKDFSIFSIGGSHVGLPLHKDYSPANIAKVVAKYFEEMAVVQGTIYFTANNPKTGFFEPYKKTLPFYRGEKLDVSVSADQKLATIKIKGISFSYSLEYDKLLQYQIKSNGNLIYRKSYNSDALDSAKYVIKTSEVLMKSIYSELGYDTFNKNLGIVKFVVK